MIQEITEGINGTHKLLLSADCNNLMAQNINTTKRNSLSASKEESLEVNTDKSKYIVACRPVDRRKLYSSHC
jgi:fructose-1,6-bisphosphatase